MMHHPTMLKEVNLDRKASRNRKYNLLYKYMN
jgi:hypothetical protein